MINDNINLNRPALLEEILKETQQIGFNAICEDKVGSILRTLAASKPSGDFLEIGTGTGVSTAWILNGMDQESNLISVEKDEAVLSVAKRFLEQDNRVQFVLQNAKEFIKENSDKRFDFIFVDAFPGKFYLLNEVLSLLKKGGIYIIDDLIPQANWPVDDHPLKVRSLISELESMPNYVITKFNWASGLIIVAKK